jgi:CHAT domain-containing protein
MSEHLYGDNRHLSEGEFASILDGRLAAEGGSPMAEHLRDCPECSRRLSQVREMEAALGGLVTKGKLSPGRGCLTVDAIGLLAAGVPCDDAERWLSHIADCDYCGSRLREAIEDLSRELTEEEQMLVEHSVSAAPARRIEEATLPVRAPVPLPVWRRPWAIAAAAALVLVGSLAGWRIWRQDEVRAVETLLARAYTVERPFDYRLPDEGHAQVSARRAPGMRPSRELLQAQARLADPAPSGSAEASWLRLRGRAALMQADFDSAIESLSRARDVAPNDPQTLTDLAVAYAWRGDANQNRLDYAPALDLVARAVQLDPNHRIAVFNYALLCERILLYTQAAELWRHYLTLDPQGNWADEARRRLADTESRISKRGEYRRRFEGGPKALLAAMGRGEPLSLDNYHETSFLRWLARPEPGSEEALTAAARVLGERHQDHWLQTVLRIAKPGDESYRRLVELAESNQGGDASGTLARAPQSLTALRQAPAAALRGRFDLVYALHRAVRPRECREEAFRLATELRGRHYPWLEIGNQLEMGVCTAMLGNEGEALTILAAAESLAERHGLTALALRAKGLRVGTETNSGNPWLIWQEWPALIEPYWNDGFPPNRLHQAAFTLSLSAEKLGYRWTAYAAAKVAVGAIAETPNRFTEALGRWHLSGLAAKIGLAPEALAELQRAQSIFSSLPPSETVATYLRDGEIALAEAEIGQSKNEAALARLAASFPAGTPAPTFLMDIQRYQLAATGYLRQQKYADAEREIGHAVHLVRARMQSMPRPAERLKMFENTAAVFRTAAALDIQQGRARTALQHLFELYGMDLAPPRHGRIGLVVGVFEGKMFLWVQRNGDTQSYQLAATPSRTLSESRRLLALAADPHSDPRAVREAGRALYETILAPALLSLTADTELEILSDGDAGRIPFDLLVLPDGRYLGEAVPIVNLRGGKTAGHVSQRFDGTLPALLAANPRPKLNGLPLPPLPDAEDEVADLRALLPHATVLLNEAVTLERLKQEGPSAVLFHFSGHGVAPAGGGALILSDRGGLLLTAERAAALDWRRCALVALAACSSAAGEFDGFANPDSLVRGFLAAGAGAVLASAWNVNSAAARALFSAFYPELLSGKPAHIALFRAANTVRATSGFGHPHYWAPFRLYR